MGFFGGKAGSRAEAPGAADVFTAPERECIEALWRLTALPRAEFDATYGAMLGGFWRFAAAARGEAWTALRRETLVCAVAALRARQARVLPRFAAAEDAARLAEVMSFALAACVVAARFAAAARRAAAPGWRPLTADVPESAAPAGAPPPRPFGALLLARLVGEAEPKRTPPPAIGGEGAGWEWINWARAGLRDGSVAVNTAGAWLHNIAGEAYVVSPACFEAFAAGRDVAPATIRNRVVRLGRHRQRASPSGSANVFRAVLADGSRGKGMVFPGELMWDDDPPPRANASLVGKVR